MLSFRQESQVTVLLTNGCGNLLAGRHGTERKVFEIRLSNYAKRGPAAVLPAAVNAGTAVCAS